MLEPFHAVVLGAVEGLTEFLPVSSTGHLILTSHWLGLHGEGLKTFEVVIQSGAVAAVAGLYRRRVLSMGQGVLGKNPSGRALLLNLLASFVPAAVVGVAFHRIIKAALFNVGAVVGALAVGGVLMIAVERWLRAAGRTAPRSLESLTRREAWLIGLAQCLALWPGTSRAMVTILAAMWLGLPATAAAEYSFLLALPTLGAATLFDAVRGGGALMDEVGLAATVIGFGISMVVAMLAMRGFIGYVSRHGLSPFGWYRLALAAVVWSAVA